MGAIVLLTDYMGWDKDVYVYTRRERQTQMTESVYSVCVCVYPVL